MADDVIQVAPNSTGAKLRTRSRTVGANTVHEQYVIAQQSDAVPVNRVWLSTLRIPSRIVAVGAVQPLFSIWNGHATNSVSVRRLVVEIDSALAHTGASPALRLLRQTAASASGTVITPVPQYTSDPTFSTLVAVRADHQGDSVSATTALTAGTIGTQPMWTQTVPRAHTLAGFQVVTEYNMLPNDSSLMAVDPLILRPSEGAHVQMMTGPLTNANTIANEFTFAFKAVLAEFTYP